MLFTGHQTDFLQYWAVYQETNAMLGCERIYMGDFNIRVDTDEDDSLLLADFLESINLKHHVDFPTHEKGHLLDLVITDQVTEWLLS